MIIEPIEIFPEALVGHVPELLVGHHLSNQLLLRQLFRLRFGISPAINLFVRSTAVD